MLGFAEELFVKSRLDSRLASLSRCPSKRLDHSCSCSSPNHEGAVGPVLFSNSHYIYSIMKKSSRATSPTTLSFMAMAFSMLPSPLLAVAVTCIRYASRALERRFRSGSRKAYVSQVNGTKATIQGLYSIMLFISLFLSCLVGVVNGASLPLPSMAVRLPWKLSTPHYSQALQHVVML